MVRDLIGAVAMGTLALPAGAVTLSDCDRTTHVSHGGEAGHRDFGAGRVAFAEWWSQEGIFTDLVVMDCATGRYLETRVREERIRDRSFDRIDDAVDVLDRAMRTDPALFSFDRLARDLDRIGRDIVVTDADDETCACAALYPEMRGDKTPYAEAG
ncbi:MAG: hypothetical protein AAFR35_04815 [Pseudomonadota bacterium]